MIVQDFLRWSRNASAAERADGASALARAYLHSDLSPQERGNAEVALTSLLDDASPLVRRAMAEALASSEHAPHHIVSALANDQSGVSALVLGRSPLLSEAELVDCAAVGDAYAQAAIALRPGLTGPVAAALAEVGMREAAIALAVNPTADIPGFALRRILERFGEDGEMREALLARPGLPAPLRVELVAATARALTAFAAARGWMAPERAERIRRETGERAVLTIAATTQDSARDLVRHLRASGALTAGFALRCLLSGHGELYTAMLTELSGIDERRVSGFIREPRGAGFAALYRQADMPPALLPAFQASLEALREFGFPHDSEASARLSRQMIERVLTACAEVNHGELNRLMALLRRYEAEAALDDAREDAAAMVAPEEAARFASEPAMLLLEGPGDAEDADAAEEAEGLAAVHALFIRAGLAETETAPAGAMVAAA